MASYNNVPQTELVSKTAEKLKDINEINPPEWAFYVKTGVHKERPPLDKGWWYVRAAAILRTIAITNPIGVSKLRAKYGGKKRRGHKPAKFMKGSGSIIRKILQQLEAAGLAEKKKKDCKGRFITTKGIRVLNDAAKELFLKYPKASLFDAKETEVKEAKTETTKSETAKPEPTKAETTKTEEPKSASESEKGLEQPKDVPKAE